MFRQTVSKRERASGGGGATRDKGNRMIKLPDTVQIYVSTVAADMRKGADGLGGFVMSVLGQQPQSGHIFVFFNRTRCIVRILFWDRDGYWLLSKRLETGRFRKLVPNGDPPRITMSAGELMELLRGVHTTKRLPPPVIEPLLH
jgi:transposase